MNYDMINRRIENAVVQGKEQDEIKRLREICWDQQKSIIDLQNRLSKYEEFNQWKNIEYFNDWSDRSEIMSHLINENSKSLLDLGCGEGHIRKFLSPDVIYYGCDYVKRDDDTIICDLSIGEFPQLIVDTIFIAGVLEYIKKWKFVLEESCKRCKQVVLSYSTSESYPDRNPIFVNNISESELVMFMNENNFDLVEKCILPYNSVGFSFERNSK